MVPEGSQLWQCLLLETQSRAGLGETIGPSSGTPRTK